jgi:hypothetical protein
MGKLLCTNSSLIKKFDETFWTQYLHILYGEEFWIRANNRPRSTSQPLISMYHEFQRLKNFEYNQLPDIWTNEKYYKWWNSIDNTKRNTI